MNSKIRFPTLLGLAILIIGLAGGLLLVQQRQIFWSQATASLEPKNITMTNITGTSAVIYWSTAEPTTGFVVVKTKDGRELIFRDDRDTQTPLPHRLHFVTITGLQPQTTYSYQLRSGSTTFPPSGVWQFTTTANLPPAAFGPVVGTIIDAAKQPVEEAIVVLEIPHALSLATITKKDGNFILPTSTLIDSNTGDTFQMPTATISAKLTVTDFNLGSIVNFAFSPQITTLPPIVLGTNLNLAFLSASPTAKTIRFDLNNDGQVNTVDLSIIFKHFNTSNQTADLNQDGIVNQKDADLLNQALKI